MQNFFLTACILGTLVIANACKDDDSGGETSVGTGTGSFTHDGDTYNAKYGIIGDYGAEDDHYNYDFSISDGRFDFENLVIDGATFYIYADLYSPGTNGFRTGTFEMDDDGNFEDDFVIDYADITFDTNNDGDIDEDDDWIRATDGQIVVSGSGTNYTLQFNLMLEDGETLTGSYTGNFRVMQDDSQRGPNGELKRMMGTKR